MIRSSPNKVPTWSAERIYNLLTGPVSDSAGDYQHHYEALHRAAIRLKEMHWMAQRLELQNTSNHPLFPISTEDLQIITNFAQPWAEARSCDSIDSIRRVLRKPLYVLFLTVYAEFTDSHLDDETKMKISLKEASNQWKIYGYPVSWIENAGWVQRLHDE